MKSAQVRRAPPTLAIVIPCYNEEAVLPETCRRLRDLMARLRADGRVGAASRVWLVDDGSRDATWSLIDAAARADDTVFCGIKLSRNRGHQIALLAGLLTAEGDVTISVDADLQDDLEVIPQMLDRHATGIDIVYGVRSSRTTDTAFKRLSAEGYYRLLNRLGVEIVFNHADYRLMSRRAVEALRGFQERNLFLRGIIPQLGFPSAIVEYKREERFAGESKYPIGKMLSLAWQGVTSFSTVPLRVITSLGVLVSLLSLGLGLWALYVRIFGAEAVPGWASTVIPLFLLSGVQLLSLGVIGEYLAKIFLETKGRPLYFIETLASSVPSQDRAAPAAQTPAAT